VVLVGFWISIRQRGLYSLNAVGGALRKGFSGVFFVVLVGFWISISPPWVASFGRQIEQKGFV
jgi:hypothetical protein